MIAIFRSSWWPAGVLSDMTPLQLKMLTNDAVIRVTMGGANPRQVPDVASRTFAGPGIVWTSDDASGAATSNPYFKYALLVNLGDNTTVRVGAAFEELGIPRAHSCDVLELWNGTKMARASGVLEASLRPHASLLVGLTNCAPGDRFKKDKPHANTGSGSGVESALLVADSLGAQRLKHDDDTRPMVAASFCDPTPEWPRSFADEFSGTEINASSWNVAPSKLSAMNQKGQCGFGMGRFGKCLAENVYIDEGCLVLKSDRAHSCSASEGCFNYTSAGVTSRDRVTWSVGGETQAGYRVCIRAQLPGGSPGGGTGIWPAHWMMPNIPGGPGVCDPDEGEIDILEMVDGNAQACGTYHWQTTWPKKNCSYPKGHESIHECAPLAKGWGSQWHEFAVEHTADYVAFVVDGKVLTNNSASRGNATAPLFWDMPFFLILNTAIGGSTGTWAKAPTADTIFPTYHKIDYVRSNSDNRRKAPLKTTDGSADCESGIDCQLNGLCTNKKCVCDTAWGGSNCSSLKLISPPEFTPSGFHSLNSSWSAWGGGAVYDPKEKRWQGVFHEISGRCGMVVWGANGQTRLAHAPKPAGPYTVDRLLMPPTATNPAIGRDAKSNTFIVTHMGIGNGTTDPEHPHGGGPCVACPKRNGITPSPKPAERLGKGVGGH